jgi:hypothetical protein
LGQTLVAEGRFGQAGHFQVNVYVVAIIAQLIILVIQRDSHPFGGSTVQVNMAGMSHFESRACLWLILKGLLQLCFKAD